MTSFLRNWRKWMHDQQDRRYLAQLGRVGLSDLGISTTDLQAITSSANDTRVRMETMARMHGLDPEALDTEHWRQVDMATACGHCGERRRCKRWLKKPDPRTPASAFCPNAKHFAELMSMRGKSR